MLLKEIRFNTDRLQYIYEHIIRNYNIPALVIAGV